jgi:exopolysaccharide biosynthesis polyprenyl glycosylphosphotransferase
MPDTKFDDQATARYQGVERRQQSRSAPSKRMMRMSSYIGLLLADVTVLALSPVIGLMLLKLVGLPRGEEIASFALIPIYVVLCFNAGGYSLDVLIRRAESIRRSASAFLMALMLTLFCAAMLKNAEDISRLAFAAGAATAFILLITERFVYFRLINWVSGGKMVDQLLILDGKPLRSPHDGSVVLDARRAQLRPDLNDPAMLDRFGRLAAAVDRIVVDCTADTRRAWALMLKGADVDGEIMLSEANVTGAIGMRVFNGHDTLLVSRKPLSLSDRAKKRALDLALTVPLIIAFSPLLIMTAVLIKLDSTGPVLFRQARVGRGNQQFKVLKFRSMRVERSDATGGTSASRDDDRITRVGRIIRKTSIDELPQLLNVLLGDMSLVGPRPHALGSLAGERLFWQVEETYWHRHQLKPGITGLAQVRGFRGATLEISDLTNRLQADMEYIADWDIWRDITILFNTVRVVVHRNAF